MEDDISSPNYVKVMQTDKLRFLSVNLTYFLFD
jgi:hypothetical protein